MKNKRTNTNRKQANGPESNSKQEHRVGAKSRCNQLDSPCPLHLRDKSPAKLPASFQLNLNRNGIHKAELRLDEFSRIYDCEGNDRLLHASSTASKILLEEFPELTTLPKLLNKHEAVFICGLPSCSEEVSTLVAIGLASIYGELFQYVGQNEGKLVARLKPKPDMESIDNTGESKNAFWPHSDDAILAPNFSTDWIQLVGVENENEVETHYFPIDGILSELSAKDIQILTEPLFSVAVPTSFGMRHQITSEPLSVLFTTEDEKMGIRLPTFACRPVDQDNQEASAALAHIKAALHPGVCNSFVIGAGDCLIFSNNRGLHSRGEITGKRLVLRCYIKSNLSGLMDKTGMPGPLFDPWSLLQ